jgi:hypothetical protein
MTETEALHTAARRYCMDRAQFWHAKYAEILKRDERPAKSGLLKQLRLRVTRQTDEGRRTFPRYKILDAILVEIERGTEDQFETAARLLDWLVAAAETAYSDEARPPDFTISSMKEAFSPKVQEAFAALGRRPKVTLGVDDPRAEAVLRSVMQEERDAFVAYVSALTRDELEWISPLPSRRTLSDEESERLWSVLKARWGVDGQWYPHDRAEDAAPPENAVAFQSREFFDERRVRQLQRLLHEEGVRRVYELREFRSSVQRQVDLELLKPWYDGAEGFWFDDSGDWLIYASHEASVTIAGERLLPALLAAWPAWREHTYSGMERGVPTEVAPGILSTAIDVEPPPGWEPPGSP